MSTPEHSLYRKRLHSAILTNKDSTDFLEELYLYRPILPLLWHLDLGLAAPILAPCYTRSSRGNTPWLPLILLRSLLLSALVGTPQINAWAKRLRSSVVLRLLAGIFDPPKDEKAPSPSIGSHYRFLNRLHDGPPLPGEVPGVRPSEQAHRRSRTPTPPHRGKGVKKERKRVAKRRQKREEEREQKRTEQLEKSVKTMDLVNALIPKRAESSPADLVSRVNRILLVCGVQESAKRGLVGDPQDLLVAGDGSPLPTAAYGLGKRTCKCPRTKSCDCDRIYADPDARRGYDSYRRKHFFGYHFYELCAPMGGHNLPMYVRIDPANTSENERAAHSREGLFKLLRDHAAGWRLSIMVHDAGHDSVADHIHVRSFGARPVIPIRSDDESDPAQHPKRPEVQLSPNGIPLCKAHVEMSSWGTAGEGKSVFVCSVKANKLEKCPLAPAEQPGWLCQPETRLGPTVNLNANDNPRLFPEIARNSPRYKDLYALRTACERSNSQKKQAYRLEQCRHRRQAFWLIRIGLAALLQHAAAWVSRIDPGKFWDDLLGGGLLAAA